jgi:hypothetical protein
LASYAQPPAPLAAAIQKASQAEGVPADVLTGIWRIESGSTYPNPFVNSSGYGGLFGTSNWNASTQDQANTAAKILADNIRSHGGSISDALYAYSGHGYTSVPGQTTAGTINPGSLGSTPSYSRGSRPGGGGSGGFLSDVEGAAENVVEGVPIVGGAISAIGQISNVFSGISDAGQALSLFFQWFTSPLLWLRVVEFLFGGILMVLGLFWLGSEAVGIQGGDDIGGVRDVAGAVGAGALIPGLGEAKVAKAASGIRKERASSRAAAKRPRTSISRQPAGVQRRAGFKLKVDEPRPKARGDLTDNGVPF